MVNELKDPAQSRVDQVFFMSIATAFTVFITVGFAGFFTFGTEVESDALQSYPGKCNMVLVPNVCCVS